MKRTRRAMERMRWVVPILSVCAILAWMPGCGDDAVSTDASTELGEGGSGLSEEGSGLGLGPVAEESEAEKGCAEPGPRELFVRPVLGGSGEVVVRDDGQLEVEVTNTSTQRGAFRLFARVSTETSQNHILVAEFALGAESTEVVPMDAAQLHLPSETGSTVGWLEVYGRFEGETYGLATPRERVYFHAEPQQWRIFNEAVRDRDFDHGYLNEEGARSVGELAPPTTFVNEEGERVGLSAPSVGAFRVRVSALNSSQGAQP